MRLARQVAETNGVVVVVVVLLLLRVLLRHSLPSRTTFLCGTHQRRQPEVSDFQNSVIVGVREKQILRLEISMNYSYANTYMMRIPKINKIRNREGKESEGV